MINRIYGRKVGKPLDEVVRLLEAYGLRRDELNPFHVNANLLRSGDRQTLLLDGNTFATNSLSSAIFTLRALGSRLGYSEIENNVRTPTDMTDAEIARIQQAHKVFQLLAS